VDEIKRNATMKNKTLMFKLVVILQILSVIAGGQHLLQVGVRSRLPKAEW
jgi:hypothetical protein